MWVYGRLHLCLTFQGLQMMLYYQLDVTSEIAHTHRHASRTYSLTVSACALATGVCLISSSTYIHISRMYIVEIVTCLCAYAFFFVWTFNASDGILTVRSKAQIAVVAQKAAETS